MTIAKKKEALVKLLKKLKMSLRNMNGDRKAIRKKKRNNSKKAV